MFLDKSGLAVLRKKEACSLYIYMLNYAEMGVSIHGEPPWLDSLKWNILLKWMIWAYPYFRKPTYLFKVSFTSEWEVSISSPFYNPGTTLVELYRHILGLCKTVKITNRNNIDLKNKYN